ncbi:RING finger protein 150-like [Pocillopora verrucosa]|uniref:RING finger protein 150-like n=1 Tax=Pocillopora verrucosa TaxID=203993 RepID=UPI003341CF1F
MAIASSFTERINIISALLLFVCVANFVNCSFYDDEQQTEKYTEAVLNITFCGRLGEKCKIKPFDGKGKFGSNSPKRNEKGWLYSLMGNNVNGCNVFNVAVDRKPWIALIKRGVCNFKNKIINARNHNATAVVIYDNKDSDEVVHMSHVGADTIVAVSIKRNLGVELADALVNRTKAVYVEISVGETISKKRWQVNPTSVLFVSVSFIVLMVISLAWLVFYYVQRFRYVHARDKTEKRLTSAAKKAIAKLPTRTVNKKTEDDESDNCAVCLDGYKAGDVVRILPCQHEFHKLCIDPWLVEHRTCPMCKLNILKELGLSSVEESRTLAVEVGTSELPDEDHRTAADNPGVVMNEIEPSVSERRPSSDGSESSSVSESGRVLRVSAEVNWERDSSSSTSNLVEIP